MDRQKGWFLYTPKTLFAGENKNHLELLYPYLPTPNVSKSVISSAALDGRKFSPGTVLHDSE